jgi:hypothetical protein
MTDSAKPDEMTPAELKLHTRLMMVSPYRQQRAARVRKAIELQKKDLAIIGRGAGDRPVTFSDAFEMVYGEKL